MQSEQALILYSLGQMGPLGAGQLKRFFHSGGFAPAHDLFPPLAALKEAGYLSQSVRMNGITYALTEKGSEALAGGLGIGAEQMEQINAHSEKMRASFQREQDYQAQYTEQSSGIVPVFLSIRDGERIVLKLSIIVEDVGTAQTICAGWMNNSGEAYDAIWAAIGEGLPLPKLWRSRPGNGEAEG